MQPWWYKRPCELRDSLHCQIRRRQPQNCRFRGRLGSRLRLMSRVSAVLIQQARCPLIAESKHHVCEYLASTWRCWSVGRVLFRSQNKVSWTIEHSFVMAKLFIGRVYGLIICQQIPQWQTPAPVSQSLSDSTGFSRYEQSTSVPLFGQAYLLYLYVNVTR